MSFSDIIKNSVLNSFSPADMSSSHIAIVLVETFVVALYIFFVYRFITRNTFYNKNFATSMAIISVVTAGIILAMQSSFVISLGMVGALSIVRFRTAVKDPLDLFYLFWSITGGITAGAGMYILTMVASIIVIIMLAIFYARPSRGHVYVAVIHYEGTETGDEIIRAFGKNKHFIKSRTMRGDTTEMAVEVYCRDKNLTFEERIRDIPKVKDITLIQYNGEYNG